MLPIAVTDRHINVLSREVNVLHRCADAQVNPRVVRAIRKRRRGKEKLVRVCVETERNRMICRNRAAVTLSE